MSHSEPATGPDHHRRAWMWAALVLLVLVLLLVALVAIAPFEGRPAPQEAEGPWAYLTVFALVFGATVLILIAIAHQSVRSQRAAPPVAFIRGDD